MRTLAQQKKNGKAASGPKPPIDAPATPPDRPSGTMEKAKRDEKGDGSRQDFSAARPQSQMTRVQVCDELQNITDELTTFHAALLSPHHTAGKTALSITLDRISSRLTAFENTEAHEFVSLDELLNIGDELTTAGAAIDLDEPGYYGAIATTIIRIIGRIEEERELCAKGAPVTMARDLGSAAKASGTLPVEPSDEDDAEDDAEDDEPSTPPHAPPPAAANPPAPAKSSPAALTETCTIREAFDDIVNDLIVLGSTINATHYSANAIDELDLSALGFFVRRVQLRVDRMRDAVIAFEKAVHS